MGFTIYDFGFTILDLRMGIELLKNMKQFQLYRRKMLRPYGAVSNRPIQLNLHTISNNQNGVALNEVKLRNPET